MTEAAKSTELMNDRDFTTLMKGLAITFVFIHHWFGWLPGRSGVVSEILNKGAVFAGTFVQIFFVASGYGLMKSAIQKPISDWRKWYGHRVVSLLVPYWGITAIMFLVARASLCFFNKGSDNLPWSILLTHLLLLRNFFPACWGFNDSLWFIPVIFGLYMIFPLLLGTLKKNTLIFCILSFFLSVGSIAVFSLLGFPTSHFASFFTFHAAQFSFGMLMAEKKWVPRSYARIHWLVVGGGCYLVSLALIKVFPVFGDFNDMLNAIGAVIVAVVLCRGIEYIPFVRKLMLFVGINSYAIYLLHGVPIKYLADPILKKNQCGTLSSLLFGGVLFGGLVVTAPWVSAGIWRVWNRLTRPCLNNHVKI
jgi:peptidoglycan/LPS O-acetylase OafA/YrhL